MLQCATSSSWYGTECLRAEPQVCYALEWVYQLSGLVSVACMTSYPGRLVPFVLCVCAVERENARGDFIAREQSAASMLRLFICTGLERRLQWYDWTDSTRWTRLMLLTLRPPVGIAIAWLVMVGYARLILHRRRSLFSFFLYLSAGICCIGCRRQDVRNAIATRRRNVLQIKKGKLSVCLLLLSNTIYAKRILCCSDSRVGS